jgi:Holliday junction resolvase
MPSPVPTEEEIQKGLVDLLEHRGFSTYHTRFSLGSDKDFPDVIAVREDGAMVALECKGPRGRLADGQRAWIKRFEYVPGCQFAAVVGPSESSHWIAYDDALSIIAEI